MEEYIEDKSKLALIKQIITSPKGLMLIGTTSAALFSLMIYKFYKHLQLKQNELDDYSSQKYEHYQKQKLFDENFLGLLGVFSNEVEELHKLQSNQQRKYYYTHGLGNLGNTCYMNSLLQVLSGSPQFMEYANKIWKHISMISTDNDSIITMTLINQLMDMNKGVTNLDTNYLFSLICQEFNTINEFEQQDSHELLVYLQERITKVTAQFLRNMTLDEGLASPELLSLITTASLKSDNSPYHNNNHEDDVLSNQYNSKVDKVQNHKSDLFDYGPLEESKNSSDNGNMSQSTEATNITQNKDSSMVFSQEQQPDNQLCQINTSIIKPSQKQQIDYTGGRLLKGILQIKDLSTNKKIGLNPFAGVYLSTIKCLRCGNDQELHRWEVFYDLSVEVKQDIYKSLEQYFDSEQIQDFTCMKCSLRTYISNESANLRSGKISGEYSKDKIEEVLDALRIMMKIPDLDEEIFLREWKDFKLKSKNRVIIRIDKIQSTISKKFSVANPPKILCLHIKRVVYSVSGDVMLNRQQVQFPDILDLSRVQSIKQNGYQVEAKYKLSGMIEHFGSAFGGHYVGYKKLFPSNDFSTKHINDKWVLCDDDKTTIIDKQDLHYRNPYMLFYERISDNKAQ